MTFTTLLGFSEWPTSHQGRTHHQRWPVLLRWRLPGRWTHKVGEPNTPFKAASLSCPALRGSGRLAFCPRISVLALVTPRDGEVWGGANHGWRRGWCLLSAPWRHQAPWRGTHMDREAHRGCEVYTLTLLMFLVGGGPLGASDCSHCRMS